MTECGSDSGAGPLAAEQTFVNADGTTPKDLISAGADGSKVLSIACTSDDTTDPVVMQLFIHDGATAYLVGSVAVPTLSGTDGAAPAVDLLDAVGLPWLDADGEFFLPSG